MQEIEEDLGQLFEEEDNDEEYRVDNKSKKKKAVRKLEEPASGKEKPVRKRKRSKQASEEKIREPPKKFSHSTRRKKRIVDQALLEMPEDEIDPQRLPIKDLILLAEHRERVAIKDAAKLKTPQTNQSADDSFRQGVSHNEEMFHSEQGQNSDDEQPTYSAQPSSSYVNYHSFMDKTPSTRWSKNDTELFYEAVQQIGTDFSIIQQLFPNRTRKQLKMKFKKEERQHPLRLSDSLNNRSKDHSHFESVIKRLQELAAQAKQEAIGNESNWHPGEEEMEEPTHNANEEHTKSELDVVVKDQEQKMEVTDLQKSPLKYDEGDDDPDRWNNYDDY
ncbi:transcription factor TFIIIB component B'' isoform X1 [Cannabis sativa]|uniref:transcription factor TFIIIB component B'' isoform X1 n=1 Tax=Cannabis sativa TaxID=3483 RepID=UPI0029CA175B|nr:transcription factor TFIIIB component B'' isoform X1 [Cannabis sativa]XP_060973525.1 transcription factor TFIIIB component B'' isoform X1 [Cannabis sativa]